MKHLLLVLSVITTLISFTPSANAWDGCNSRIVGYTRCGRPIVAVYQVCGYDRCGHPIGHWVTQSSQCGCEICNPRPRYDGPSCGRDYRSRYSSGYRSGFYFSFER